MQGRGGFPDRFANNDIIPHFNQNGTALTQEERAAIAKRKGICVNCGVKTHAVSVFTKKLTNDDVYKGVCIKCNPTSVPSKILQEYEVRNPRINAPVVPASRQQAPRPKRSATNPVAASAARQEQHQHRHARPSSITGGHSDPHLASANSNGPSTRPSSQSRSKAKQSHLSPMNSRGKLPAAARLPQPPEMDPNSLSALSQNNNDLHASFKSSSNASFVSGGTSSSRVVGGSSKWVSDYTGGVSSPSDVDVDKLLQALKNDRGGDVELLTQTLHRLRNFGYDRDPTEAISEIRDLMDEYRNDSRVMAIACSALWRLSSGDKSHKIEAAENGAIESIVEALRRDQNLEDVEFIQWSVGCLASLADAKEVKKFIATMGGIEVIVDVLNRHQEAPGIFEWAARALHNLGYQREDEGKDISDVITRNLFSIEEAGGIKALVGAMRQHPNESTAQRWAMRLLWSMQDQDDEDVVARILRKMKDDGFVKASVKVLKARATDGETDLFRLSADLMCNILSIDRSETAFRDAADCLTTVARNLKAGAPEDSARQMVKLESCCRVVATLMNGTEYSRMIVSEASGVQAVLEAIEQHPNNPTLLQNGIWAFWSMSAAERETDKDDLILIRAVELVSDAMEAQTDNSSELLLPVCGFFSNMCLVPGMNPAKVPIARIVQSLFIVDEDSVFLKEAERTVTNFCTAFPDQVDLVVDALDLNRLLDTLDSDNDLTPTLAAAIASVASKSDRARSRIASPEIIASLTEKLRDPDNPFMMKPYLELMATLVISGNQKSTRLPEDIVQIVLRIIESGSAEIKWLCCALLRNLIGSAAAPPDVSGLVDCMVAIVDSPGNTEHLKIQACGVLWSLTGKYPKQSVNHLAEMSRSMINILIQYKGDQGPFDYDLLAMAAGALASVTASMLHSPVQVSSEDVDEIISVPYTALDFEADRTELYVRILDSIYNLSYVSDAVLIQCGVIVVVIDTMAEFEQCLEVQQFGCAILAVLASTENLQVNLSIVQTDGIDMIVNALALFSDDKVVQSQACKALSHLSIDEESRMLIASLGGLMLLGNTMRANMDELDLLEGALSAVLSLSADADVELLTESNIVAVVVAVMRHHRANSQIQEFGMGVLQNISMRCFESKQNIAEAGGILAVADCIREFMGSPTVLERAFTTLWSLAVLDSNQALIAEADGINLVVNGMMTAITYEGVQKQGCGCLCTLSSDSRNKGLIQNVGGVDSIVYAMWAHYGAEEIQVEACRALSSLAVDAQTNEVMIASDGEVNAIISAMRRFPMSERLQEHACVALRNFLLSADNVDIIKSNEHEVKTLVQQAASRFPEACSERANQVLASLG